MSDARLDSASRAPGGGRDRRLADPDADTRQACRDYWAVGLRPRLAEPDRTLRMVKSDLCASDPAGIRYGLRSRNRVIMASYGDWDLRASDCATLPVPTLVVHGEAGDHSDGPGRGVGDVDAARPTPSRAARGALHVRGAPELVWPAVERFLAEPPRTVMRRVVIPSGSSER